MLQRSKSWRLVVAASMAYAPLARAQVTPPSAASPGAASPSADDDVEIPAAPASSSATAPNGTPKTPAGPASTATPDATMSPDELQSRIAELERRLSTLEKARIASEASTQADASNPKKQARFPLGIRVGGYVQGQFETNRLSQDQLQQGGEPLNQDRFTLRRARLLVERSFKYASGAIELDANTVRGVSVGIRRAEASVFYRPDETTGALPLLASTLGVTDIPFGSELGESARTRPFMERSVGSLALFPTEADAGVKIWGAVSFLRYGLALMNGEPLDARGFPRDPNAAKDLVGRIGFVAKPASTFSVSGGTSFAKGKGFHAGQDATKDTLAWVDLDGRSTVTLPELLGIKGVSATPSKNFARWALGVDLRLSLTTRLGETQLYGEAFVASNYDRGLVVADPVSTGFDIRHFGASAALVQGVTRHAFVGFRFGYYDPNSDILEQRRNRFVPVDLGVTTLSPLVGLTLPGQAKLSAQYDVIRDHLARDPVGVPADAANDVFTLRLQVEL